MYAFLSEEWIEAAREIRARYESELPEITVTVRINQVITEVPFGDGIVHAHVDTTGGAMVFELGHVDEPDAVVMTDYETARAMLVERDPAVIMGAMMQGRVQLQGDMMKLLAAMQHQAAPTELAERVADEIAAITA
jgi:putative sterol carrier protein